jgi:hypothetical protein
MADRVKYVLDLENIMKFVFESDSPRDSESEIIEMYSLDTDSKDMLLNTKQLREVKGGDGAQKATIKYDMLKMFIDTLLDLDVSENSQWSFGEALIFNTMAENELIKEVKENA